jgi:phosphoribosylaminoimidazole-succinocarboxamide synthase
MSMASLSHLHRGKVRDLYDAGDGRLLMVASDRLSAFDVVMAEPVPDKGRVLTAMSVFWFERLADVCPNHLISAELATLPSELRDPRLAGRMVLVHRCQMLTVECIVRGYLAGTAWQDYRATGSICGVALRAGLVEADRLPEPIFTPSTKAAVGVHDENITFDDVVALVGRNVAERARSTSLEVYREAAAHAESRGIIVADTKLELGLLDGELVLADEVLTPDSSRFWPAEQWQPGRVPPSFDKQPVRDELTATGWDRRPPPPPLSAATIAATRARYIEGYERLSGRSFADWPGASGTMGG